MILKIIESKNKLTINTLLLEGDTIAYYAGENPGVDHENREEDDYTGMRFEIDKQGKHTLTRFISNRRINKNTIHAYIINDNGKTISHPIGH